MFDNMDLMARKDVMPLSSALPPEEGPPDGKLARGPENVDRSAGSPLAQVLKALDPSPSAKVEDVTAAAAEEVRNLPSAVAPVPQLDASPQLASATG